jgi:hypothetical protein
MSPDSDPYLAVRLALGGTGDGSGEGKVTRLELFAAGVLALHPAIRDLIRAA